MGEIDRTKVSLRLFGHDLDPDSITSLLGRQPTRSWRAGEMKFGRPAKFGSWHLKSDFSGDLDTQIKDLLTSLSSNIVIWTDLTKQHHADL
jgi:hypothetical protein